MQEEELKEEIASFSRDVAGHFFALNPSAEQTEVFQNSCLVP